MFLYGIFVFDRIFFRNLAWIIVVSRDIIVEFLGVLSKQTLVFDIYVQYTLANSHGDLCLTIFKIIDIYFQNDLYMAKFHLPIQGYPQFILNDKAHFWLNLECKHS